MPRSHLTALALLALALALPAGADSPEPKPTADWPQWRGPKRDAISAEKNLMSEWPKDGPTLLWRAKGIGRAYSSVSVVGERIYTMGDRGGKQYVICLDATKEGKELWATPIGGTWQDGGPRSTPTVDGKYVYALGTDGIVMCLEAESGKEKWSKDLAKDCKGRVMSSWNWSESVLIDGDHLICTPGSDAAAMLALKKDSGEEVWRTAMKGTGGAGYSSVVIAEVKGVKMYINWLGSSLIGVNTKDGKLLWKYTKARNGTANIPTPLVKGDLVFCSTAYNTGSALLRLVPDKNGGVEANEEYFLDYSDLQNHHGGMVLLGDHVYCGHDHNGGKPRCVELKTGKIAWQQDRGPGSGSAAVMYADGHLYFRYDDNTMALIEAKPDGYKLKSKFALPRDTGRPGWQHPVIVGGKLYIRGADSLLCYDIKKK